MSELLRLGAGQVSAPMSCSHPIDVLSMSRPRPSLASRPRTATLRTVRGPCTAGNGRYATNAAATSAVVSAAASALAIVPVASGTIAASPTRLQHSL